MLKQTQKEPWEEGKKHANSYPFLHAFQKCTEGKHLVTMIEKGKESWTTTKSSIKENIIKMILWLL